MILSSSMYPQVITCPVCQRMNKKIDTGRPELHPIPIKSPWYHVGVDFIGPISPPSTNGNRYILTVRLLHSVWMGEGSTNEGG